MSVWESSVKTEETTLLNSNKWVPSRFQFDFYRWDRSKSRKDTQIRLYIVYRQSRVRIGRMQQCQARPQPGHLIGTPVLPNRKVRRTVSDKNKSWSPVDLWIQRKGICLKRCSKLKKCLHISCT